MDPESEMLNRLKEHFNFDNWARRKRLHENLLVRNFFFSDRPVPEWRLQKTEEMPWENLPKCTRSLWTNPALGPDANIRCDAYECDSLEAAHEFLIRILSTFHLPLVTQRDDLHIGDVAFAPPGESSIAFARANVAFVVTRAGRKEFSVLDFAAQLDADLASKPEEPDSSGEMFSLSMTSPPGAGPASGRLDVKEEEGGPALLKFFSPTAELEVEDGNLVYKTAGDTDETAPEITMYAVDRHGHTTRQSVRAKGETEVG